MENTPWKEYETGGRKYWVHERTKETTWNAPKEIAGKSLPLVETEIKLIRTIVLTVFRYYRSLQVRSICCNSLYDTH